MGPVVDPGEEADEEEAGGEARELAQGAPGAEDEVPAVDGVHEEGREDGELGPRRAHLRRVRDEDGRAQVPAHPAHQVDQGCKGQRWSTGRWRWKGSGRDPCGSIR